jgi:hypothetical protein
MSRNYISSPPCASVACCGTALLDSVTFIHNTDTSSVCLSVRPRALSPKLPDEFLEGFFLFLSFDFLLLSPCKLNTEQWLWYHWWYGYHSLRNPGLCSLQHAEFSLRDTLVL